MANITNDYEKNIENLLKNNSSKFYTMREISKILKVNKLRQEELYQALNKLVNEQKIVLRNKHRYGINKAASPKTIVGRFDATSMAHGYSYAFVIGDKEDIFVDSEDTLNAFHGDIVEVDVKYKRKGSAYGVIRAIKERANKYYSGNIEKQRNRYFFVPDYRKIHRIFDVSNLNSATVNDKVMLEIEFWGDYKKNPSGKVSEILGAAGDRAVEEMAIVRQLDLPLSFPDEVMNEIDSFSSEIDEREIAKRDDFRSVFTITVDPPTAKDYDDAISFEKTADGWDLFVHIADVSHYVKPGSAIFNEAVNRGNSYYFPLRVIPMLPEKLSNMVCSLRANEEKLVMTVVTSFDNSYKIIGQRLCEGVINSNARLNYGQVDDYFDGKESDLSDEVKNILDNLRQLSRYLYQQRYERGYIPFDLPDLEFSYDENLTIDNILRNKETESHKIIENCMLLANEYVATELAKKTKEGIYRVHEEPDGNAIEKVLKLLRFYHIKGQRGKNTHKLIQGLLEAMPDKDHHRVFDFFILRSMKKARYDTAPIGHFGLAMEFYTHFTSPIRRLSDLVVHHLARDIVLKKKKSPGFWDSNTLKDMAITASEKELLADDAERQTEMLFKKIYMQEQLGEIYSGLIVNISKTNIVVELDDIPITGVIPIASLTDDKYRFYQEYMELIGNRSGRVIKLVERVNVRVDKIDFDVILSFADKKEK